MRVKENTKILFNKTDIAEMLGVSIGVFRQTAQVLKVDSIDWTCRNQRFTDDQVHEIIKQIRKRLTDAEIDAIINQNARFSVPQTAVLP